MEVEEKKETKSQKPVRGGKRAAKEEIDDTKTKQPKVEATTNSVTTTPPKSQEPVKEFMSPLASTKKLANSARSFLTPVKNTPSKALITPRSLKPSQGKILPKIPLQFSYDDKPVEKKVVISKEER
jgi:hypothetical protein